MLGIKSNGSYTLDMAQAERLPSGCQMVATDKSSIEKNSIEKKREEEDSGVESSTTATSTNENENDENSFRLWGGTLGKGVVMLTDKQEGMLLDELGIDGFDYYVEKLADFIIEKKAKVANHYATIMKWAREDAKV